MYFDLEYYSEQPTKERALCLYMYNLKVYLRCILSQESLGDRLHRNKGVNQIVMENDLRTAAVTRQEEIQFRIKIRRLYKRMLCVAQEKYRISDAF